MTVITSKTNENINLYRRLSYSKKARYTEKLYTLEGVRLITDAAKEAARFHCVFASDGCMEKYGETLKFLADEYKNRFYTISDELAEYISETDGTQGLFAIALMPEDIPLSDMINENGRYIMLSNVQDPGNMGTVIRTADAVGVDGIICCGCCDIYNPKTIRSTMGSMLRVPVVCSDEDSAFAALSEAGIKTYAAVIDKDAVSLTDCDFSKGGAVLIGNEGSGLSHETADRCDVKMTIRMHGSVNSLNAAMAAGIIMWELCRKL